MVSDQRGQPVEDAVVIAVPTDQALRLPARPRDATILQVDKEFFPRVSVIVVGTPVAFPNNDDVRFVLPRRSASSCRSTRAFPRNR